MTVIIAHANGSKVFDNIPILEDGVMVSALCQGGMCLFLILSGYGLYKSYYIKGLNYYWDNKFKKIFMPAMMAQCSWSVLYIVVRCIWKRDFSLSILTNYVDLICCNSANGIDPSMWYLSYLLCCYITFYIVFVLIKNERCKLVSFLVLWIVIMPLMPMIWSHGFYCISSFAVGVIISYLMVTYPIHIPKIIKTTLVIGGFGGGLMYWHFFFRKNSIIDNVASNLIAVAFIIMAGFMLSKFKLRVLHFVGKHSFAIYLFQGKIMFGRFPYTNYSNNIRFIMFIALFMINLLVAVAFDTILEKLYLRMDGSATKRVV